jgi:hypothetical protein
MQLESCVPIDDMVSEPYWDELFLTMYALGLNLVGIPAIAPLAGFHP